jgi:hypothetical protein
LTSIAATRARAAVDAIVLVELRRAQRYPVVGRGAREEVFRQIGRSHGGESSALSIVSAPSKPSRRSISAAASPAAPPPTMTTDDGTLPDAGDRRTRVDPA